MRRAVPVAVVAVTLLLSCSGSSGDSAPSIPTSPPVPSSEATTSSSAPQSAATTAAQAGPEACRAPDVEIAFLDSRAAAGHSLAVFVVRNPTTRACRLTGHPGVEALDSSGRVLATAGRGAGSILSASPPGPVVVAPRGTAYFAVESESVCPDDAPPSDSERVRVVLPDDASPAEVAATISVCPGPELLVSPVRATQSELAGG